MDCNLISCRYNRNKKCTNKEKRIECLEVSKAVLCLGDDSNDAQDKNRTSKGKLYLYKDND